MKIDAEKEAKKIIRFIKDTFAKANFSKAVIGLSGGIDSVASMYLLTRALPAENIYPIHLHYFDPLKNIKSIVKSAGIPGKNLSILSIKRTVDSLKEDLSVDDKLRLGNIMARTRMIFLYDLAKKNNALVCGTENRSEHYLGYFTRFGDEASDLEPILSLYKTQVKQLARYLRIPEEIIDQAPTAGLWEGQTDEGEMGFSYSEADEVLKLFFDEGMSLIDIEKHGHHNAKEIMKRVGENNFKHFLPHKIRD